MKAFLYEKYGPPQTLRMAQAGKPAPNAGEACPRVSSRSFPARHMAS